MAILREQIDLAKSKMGEYACEVISADLLLDGWDKEKMEGICPFHSKDGHPEHTPSFKWMEKSNNFYCFGCDTSYDILDHYQSQGKTMRESLQQLFSEAEIEYNIYEDSDKDAGAYPTPENDRDKSKVYEYLGLRKISKQTIDDYDIKQSSSGEIAFEHYNQYDRLCLTVYRPSHKLSSGENKSRVQNKNSKGESVAMRYPLWNMNRVVFHKPLVITEGVVDCLSVIESGYTNAVSVPMGAHNTHWLEDNYDWLDNFDSFIICADNDEAGEKMKNEIMPRLGDWRCKTISYPLLPTKREANDLNEVLYYFDGAFLNKMIVNATDVPIEHIVDMADVEDIDLAHAEGIKSGLKCIDKRIAKFFLGTVAIHTGINGSGKSSLLNQICVVEPTNQGYKSFVFSGELSKSQLRNWVEYPMAGVLNVEEQIVADDQPIFYRVKKDAKKIMREWYRGKIFFYDNELDRTAESILDRMTVMARKHGVKNFLIDNLMTVDIMNYKGDSIWEKQKEFVLDLVRFAITFKVVVHLVAHPRKLDFVKRLTKMDVSGTGDITNLAHYVFAVHRVTPEEKEGTQDKKGDWVKEPMDCDAIVDLFKNRPIGFQDMAFKLNFDRKTKRFFQDDEEKYKQYGWDNKKINIPRLIEEDMANQSESPFE